MRFFLLLLLLLGVQLAATAHLSLIEVDRCLFLCPLSLEYHQLHLAFISRWSNNLWLGLFFLCGTFLQERPQIGNSTTTLLPLYVYNNNNIAFFPNQVGVG